MAITLSSINIGTGPGAGNGDPLRTAFNTINNNFALIQANLNANVSATTSTSSLNNNGWQLALDSTGNTLVPKNLTVSGTLTVLGNVTTVNQEIINSSEIVAGNLYANVITTIAGNLTLDPGGNSDVVVPMGTTLWLSDTSVTTNPTSGALIIAGGAGIGGDVNVAGNITGPTITALQANAATQSDLIIAINANVIAANTGIKGYIDLANTIQSNQLTASNVAWAANAVAQQSLIANLQASAYSNVNVASYLNTQGYNLYSNVNVAAYLNTQGYNLYSNVNVIAYLAGNITVGNIVSTSANIAGIVLTNNNIYSWQLATDIQFGQLAATANIVMNRNVVHNRDLNVIGNITANNITLSGNVTGNINGYAIGYRDIPQVTSANVTFALTDGGKHYYSTTAVNTLTVPNNTNVAFPTGTAISIINGIGANIAIALQANVTMYLATNNISSSRTITGYGMATLIKVNTNTWYINGSGVV